MKDYSVELEEKEDFLLGYEITTDDMIILKYANGNTVRVFHTDKIEELILNKMKKQINNSNDFLAKQDKEKNFFKNNIMIFLFGTVISMLSRFFCVDILDYAFIYSFTSLCSVGFICSFVKFIQVKSKLSDLEKNKRFIKMESQLNDYVKSNQNTLKNVSKKTIDFVRYSSCDKPVFNINSFNYVPYRDLEQIMKSIEENNELTFENNMTKKEKTKVKKKIR